MRPARTILIMQLSNSRVNCGLTIFLKIIKVIRIKDNCYFSVFTCYRSNLIIVSVKNPTFRRYITHQLRKIIGQFTIPSLTVEKKNECHNP